MNEVHANELNHVNEVHLSQLRRSSPEMWRAMYAIVEIRDSFACSHGNSFFVHLGMCTWYCIVEACTVYKQLLRDSRNW